MGALLFDNLCPLQLWLSGPQLHWSRQEAVGWKGNNAAVSRMMQRCNAATTTTPIPFKEIAMAWLQSYLTDRAFFVQIDGAASTVRPIRFGVP